MQAIDIRKTRKVADEFERELRTLTGLQERLQDVYRRFPQVMDNPEIRSALSKQIEGMEREKLGYRKLAATLDRVSEQYAQTDERIAAYAEEVGAGTPPIVFSVVTIPQWIFSLVR